MRARELGCGEYGSPVVRVIGAESCGAGKGRRSPVDRAGKGRPVVQVFVFGAESCGAGEGRWSPVNRAGEGGTCGSGTWCGVLWGR